VKNYISLDFHMAGIVAMLIEYFDHFETFSRSLMVFIFQYLKDL
jgi:hypothetical protein